MKKTLAATAAVVALGVVAGLTLRAPKSGCVAAPLDGGTDCKRSMRAIGDTPAGPRYFGAGNSFPAREAVGTCEPMPPKSCSGGE